MLSVAYVGMDVHKDTIRLAILPERSAEFVDQRTVPTEAGGVKKYLRSWSARYELRCFYEASSCGYLVQRWLAQEAIWCAVVAPSKTPRAPGVAVKTDRRDARMLAVQGRAGALVSVHVPTLDEEAVRGLVCQYGAQRQLVRAAKQRVQAWLLLRGQVYAAGEAWTATHWRWLKSLRFAGVDDEVFHEYVAEVIDLQARVVSTERRLLTLTHQDAYRDGVGRLCCFRGITPVRALVLVASTITFARFPGAEEYMSYAGLVSSESSSGAHRHQGRITKAGNEQLRYELIEAA